MRLHRLSSRAPIALGQKLGKGGEGAVYAVHGAPDLVAKVYQKPPRARKIDKLDAMTRAVNPSLLRVAAWPTDLLGDEQRIVRGFLMPRVAARHDVHELYSPKSRAKTFPDADFRFVTRAATNIARAFALMHAQGHVIGDVNHGNALIGRDATVVLIDCDSFQIRHRDSTYSCDVGVPLFTAPELQGRAFRGLRRTNNHDAFGLAVLLFHLLYMGRHPFAGRFLDGEMSIEQAIAEFRFAYGPDAHATGVQPPPGTLPLDAFGSAVAELFVQAFAREGVVTGRPSAEEWVGQLSSLESQLIACGRAAAHFHRADSECPWCELQQLTQVRSFAHVEPVDRLRREVEAIWESITSMEPPPLPPALRSTQRPAWRESGSLDFVRFVVLFTGIAFSIQQSVPLAILGIVLSFAFFFSIALVLRWVMSSSAHKRALKAAEAHWALMLSRWQQACTNEDFQQVLARLTEIRSQLLDLSEKTVRREKLVESWRENYQCERFLERFRIEEAFGFAVNGAQVMALASVGIHSAADLYRGRGDPDDVLPPPESAVLRAWYEQKLAGFSFDRNETLDAHERSHINARLHAQQAGLLEALRAGPSELQEARLQVMRDRAQQQQLLNEAWDLLKATQRPATAGPESKRLIDRARNILGADLTPYAGALRRAAVAGLCLTVAWHLAHSESDIGFGSGIGRAKSTVALLGLAGVYFLIRSVKAFLASLTSRNNRPR